MQKPTYYLWRSEFSTESEYENTKVQLIKEGFRIVTFTKKPDIQQISPILRMLIQNHLDYLSNTSYQTQASQTHTPQNEASL